MGVFPPILTDKEVQTSSLRRVVRGSDLSHCPSFLLSEETFLFSLAILSHGGATVIHALSSFQGSYFSGILLLKKVVPDAAAASSQSICPSTTSGGFLRFLFSPCRALRYPYLQLPLNFYPLYFCSLFSSLLDSPELVEDDYLPPDGIDP